MIIEKLRSALEYYLGFSIGRERIELCSGPVPASKYVNNVKRQLKVCESPYKPCEITAFKLVKW